MRLPSARVLAVPLAAFSDQKREMVFVQNSQGLLELRRILSRLSQREREFLELRYGMELTDGEIALLCGTSREAIRKRYERLLAKCRRM